MGCLAFKVLALGIGQKNDRDTTALFPHLDDYIRAKGRANELGDKDARTPLQTDMENLKMAGVIWDGSQIAALVETPDSHGHTIKVGSLLGPNYGVVESVDQEKIVIIERVRDFEGNIISVTQVLKIGQ